MEEPIKPNLLPKVLFFGALFFLLLILLQKPEKVTFKYGECFKVKTDFYGEGICYAKEYDDKSGSVNIYGKCKFKDTEEYLWFSQKDLEKVECK